MLACVLRRHYREPVVRQTLVFVDERQRTCGVENMFVSIVCGGLHTRTPQVHVPAFADSYLPGGQYH
jgi:hypothetical protein